MADPKVTAFGALGAGVGALQTPLLRHYVDAKHPAPVPSLKGYGTYSALLGIGGGAVALIAGVYGMRTRKMSDRAVEALVDYGTVALISGLISGALPVSATSEGAPSVRYAGGMEQLQRLSMEIQRLSTENSSLRAQSMGGGVTVTNMQPLPGAVAGRQRQYQFMEPGGGRALVPSFQGPVGHPPQALRREGFMGPGQAYEGARRTGFMNPSMDTAAMAGRGKYGFLTG